MRRPALPGETRAPAVLTNCQTPAPRHEGVRRWLASSRGDTGVITPGWHCGHVCQGLAFDLRARCARAAPGLPGGHSLEPLLKGLELAGLVGAVAAVSPGFDRHAAAFTGGRFAHDVLL